MIRSTKQRHAIQQAFKDSERPLTPQNVLEIASAHVPSLGVATVYREIRRLLEEGVLAVVDVPGHSTCYEYAQTGHNVFFRCDRCGDVYGSKSVDVPLKGNLPSGFRVENHQVFLYGRCRSCSKKKS